MRSMRWTLAIFAALALSVALARAAYARAAEGSFERTLKVTGPVELEVTTGSGNITVGTGDAATVRIRGRIRVGEWRLGTKEAERRVRALESNPPIEQTGNWIRIGRIEAPALRRNVSISYELEVPAETKLTSETGSGDQSAAGIRGPVRASTGSGNIRLENLGGMVRANTGSGDIEIGAIAGPLHAETGSGSIRSTGGIEGGITASTGSGDVVLQQTAAGTVNIETGSGNIEVMGIRGGVRLHTGSGNITAEGKPSGEWKLDTGSGNITARLPADAAFDLHLHTGSGDIRTDHPITVEGKIGRHELRGKVRGGGVLVEAGTGSGNVRVE